MVFVVETPVKEAIHVRGGSCYTTILTGSQYVITLSI